MNYGYDLGLNQKFHNDARCFLSGICDGNVPIRTRCEWSDRDGMSLVVSFPKGYVIISRAYLGRFIDIFKIISESIRPNMVTTTTTEVYSKDALAEVVSSLF